MKNKFQIKYPIQISLLIFVFLIIILVYQFLIKQLIFSFYYLFAIPIFLIFILINYYNLYINNFDLLIVEDLEDIVSKKQKIVDLLKVKKIVIRNSKPNTDLIFEMEDSQSIKIGANIASWQETKLINYITSNYKQIRITRLD